MTAGRREEIIRQAMELRHMPQAVRQVSSLMGGDGEPDLDEIVSIVQYDPVLTVNILSLANSSFFSRGRKLNSVREAAIRLGVKRLVQMIIALGVAPYAKPAVKGYGLDAGQLLEHSIAVALASERLAHELGMTPPAHTFTAGLLVDIGKIVLGRHLEIDAGPILEKAWSENLSFEDAEEAVLGINHCELGALLLEHWQLPAHISSIVRWRAKPELCPGPDLALDLVHAGDILAKMTGIGAGIDGLQYQLSPVVIERLGLSPEVQESVMAQIVMNREELVNILSRPC